MYDDIYYLNTKETEEICKKINISIYIHIYDKTTKKYIKTDNKVKKTFLIKKILKFLRDYKLPTIFIISPIITKFEDIRDPNENDYIYYGQYSNENKQIISLIKKLTDNKFHIGIIADNILLKYWLKGIMITYKEFAKKWLIEIEKKQLILKYIKYLDIKDWKTYRQNIAYKVIKEINKKLC